MARFINEEANFSVELSIEIEVYIKKLNKALEQNKISTEKYIQNRKRVDELIKKNKDLIVNWRKEIQL